MLHLSNAPAYLALPIKDFLTKHDIHLFLHPHYVPDLAHSDFFVPKIDDNYLKDISENSRNHQKFTIGIEQHPQIPEFCDVPLYVAVVYDNFHFHEILVEKCLLLSQPAYISLYTQFHSL
jgi:hypothetical protein